MRSNIETEIRATLAEPPGHAGIDPGCRATYIAAILMYEQLLEAARETEHLASPLPLFYALSQASRAIAAANGDAHAKGHGLQQAEIRSPVTSTSVRTAKGGGGLFAAVGGGALEPVELGAIWSALPDLADALPSDLRWPAALPVIIDNDPSQGTNVTVVFPPSELSAAKSDPSTHLARYPRARYLGATPVSGQAFPPAVVVNTDEWGPGIACAFGDEKNDAGIVQRHRAVQGEVPEHRYLGEYWLVPAINDEQHERSSLVLWWVFLFGLSILARYEPAVWRSSLDPVESPLAVRLENAMDIALEAVPHWILTALYDGTRSVRVGRP